MPFFYPIEQDVLHVGSSGQEMLRTGSSGINLERMNTIHTWPLRKSQHKFPWMDGQTHAFCELITMIPMCYIAGGLTVVEW